MKDPIRIREPGSDASSELRELFRDAQRPQPLTPTIQADLASRVASIAATRGTLLTAVTAKAPIFLVGAALLGASIVALREPTPKTEPVAPVEPVSTGSSAPPRASSMPAPVSLEGSPIASAEPPTRPHGRGASVISAPQPSSEEDTLPGETQLLNEAHRALSTDPNRALAIAREHAKRYPRGQLAAERELILVQALVKLGRRREAEAKGRGLRKAAPNSIYEERLDKVLGAP